MYREDEDGNIVITLNRDTYNNLLLCLGYASGAAAKDREMAIATAFMKLANAINEGNSNWTPYQT